MAIMVKKQRLDARITVRLLPQEREEAERLCQSGETLGDFIREAVNREIARRRRSTKKATKTA